MNLVHVVQVKNIKNVVVVYKKKKSDNQKCNLIQAFDIEINGLDDVRDSGKINLDLSKAKYFAGHSLGEYSALSSAGYLDFSDTIKLLRLRGY